MLALLPLAAGFLIPPAPHLQPLLQQQVRAAHVGPASIFPVDGLDATTLIADENGKWISASFDDFAALTIPFILAGLLFALFKLAKLFASAF